MLCPIFPFRVPPRSSIFAAWCKPSCRPRCKSCPLDSLHRGWWLSHREECSLGTETSPPSPLSLTQCHHLPTLGPLFPLCAFESFPCSAAPTHQYQACGRESTVVLVPECVKYFPISSPSELHHRHLQRAGEGREGLTRGSVQRVGGAELHGKRATAKAARSRERTRLWLRSSSSSRHCSGLRCRR